MRLLARLSFVFLILTLGLTAAVRHRTPRPAGSQPPSRSTSSRSARTRTIATSARAAGGEVGGRGAQGPLRLRDTSGDAGHQSQGGGALAARRRAEAKEAGRRIGVDYITLDNHDGELVPELKVREQIIRLIRDWKADLVLGPRPNDYHPDHRYTGVLLSDAAFMVTVPNICPDTPALRRNPVFMLFEDNFQKPMPFSPDVVVSIDDVAAKKLDMIDAHVSQVYEWLPWLNGRLDQVPKDAAARREWLGKQRRVPINPAVRAALVKKYGAEIGGKMQAAEAFEISEYGRRPNEAEIKRLFPF